MPPSRRASRATLLLALVCISTYGFVVATNLDKPFTTDEVYYAGWAHGIAESGQLRYYTGEIEHYRGRPLDEPLSHPPLHFYLLAVLVQLFGLHYWSLRLLGVLFFVTTLLFLVLVLPRRVPVAREQMLVTSLLLVFNPLFVQQGLVLAIEAQVFWLPMLLFLFVFHLETSAPRPPARYAYPVTTALLVGLLWFKVTPLPTYLLACLGYLALRRQIARAAQLALATGVAIGVFWLTWIAYCQLTGVALYSWLEFTVLDKMVAGPNLIHRVLAEGGVAPTLQRVGSRLALTATWISIPYALLFSAAVVVRVRELARGACASFFDLCLLYALSVFLFSHLLYVPTMYFPKYQTPAFLFVALFVADVACRRFGVGAKRLVWPVLAGVAVGVALFPIAGDRVLAFPEPLGPDLVAGVLMVLALAGSAWIARPARADVAIAWAVAAVVALNSHLYLHQSAGYTTGSSWYSYGGTSGRPIAWLREHLEDGESFAAFKDIQFNVRFVEGKSRSATYEVRALTRDPSDRARKAALLAGGGIRFLVLGPYSRDPPRAELLARYYREVWRDEDFVILEHRSRRSEPAGEQASIGGCR